MADILLEFLRRYANTINLRSISQDHIESPLVLDIPKALSSLANDQFIYTSIQSLPLTEVGFPYLSLGLNHINDALQITDSLLFSEQPLQTLTKQAIDKATLTWILSDSSGSKIFIPARDDYYLLVKGYLPHIRWWEGKLNGVAYPKREYYLRGGLRDWPEIYELVLDGIEHPYAKGLYLTGYVALQTDGVPNYEYIDLDGYYGGPGLTYISSLRPPGIDYPLGRPKGGDLVKDLCVGEGGWFPETGNGYWVGRYSGYRTTSSYHPTVTFYLYERGDGSVFLWEGRPHRDAWLWVGNALEWGGVTLGVGLGSDGIYIQDYSCGVGLLLEDASQIPTSYQYPYPQDVIGDCSNFDDIYILKGGRRVYRYVDDLFPVADLLMFTDMP